MYMNKGILFGFTFLLLMVAVTALSDSQSSLNDLQIKNMALSDSQIAHITNLVKEAGCPTNDAWGYHGQCFGIPGVDCWLCYSCWGPFCSEPRYCGCGQYVC
ncbi:MAG: hypothetical protein AABX70_07185 [Nanoarchaeota archaeon]